MNIRKIEGIVRLPAPAPQSGRLVMLVEDVTLADAPSVLLCRLDKPVRAGEGPDLEFVFECKWEWTGARRIGISARLLFHEGDDLRRGDAASTVFCAVTERRPCRTLNLQFL
jgi:hypothetical protein